MTADRVILPFRFDAEKMQAEVDQLCSGEFQYYDVIQLRGPAHLIDPSRPFPPPADDYADGSWTDWLDAPQLEKVPYIREVIDSFREHTTVNLVRLLRLAPGAVIAEHTDPTLALEVERSMVRLTVPIQNPEEVDFLLNGTSVPLKNGECWYLRLSDPHEIRNMSEKERINLTIDMIPNEWLRDVIAEAEKEM